MVVALHLNVAWGFADNSSISIVYPICGIAIPLFFMVSGYLMAGRELTIRYAAKKVFNILKLTIIICLLYDLYIYFRKGDIIFDFPACLIQKGDWWHFWYFGSMIVIYSLLPFVAKYLNGKNLKYILLTLFVVCVGFWLSNIFCLFEKKHIIQTFRLWYFFFYFLVGYYCKRQEVLNRPHWALILCFMLPFVLSVLFLPSGGNEFHFGSPLCMGYAVSAFLYLVNSPVKSAFVSFLSPVVLPTYVFHVIIINRLTMGVIHPLFAGSIIPYTLLFPIELIVTVLACFLFSLLLMRVPKIEVLFKL